jgi:GntP family gluconate:H+ symporter
LSLAPVVLPVILITCNTVLKTIAGKAAEVGPTLQMAVDLSNIVGNANFALLISTVIALLTLVIKRKLTRSAMAHIVETSLMSGGVIILITAGGGAFGAMLKEAQVGAAIESLFAGTGGAGIMLLIAGFGVAAILKVAQGSSTAAMIVGSAMFAELATPETLGFHPVYLATAIGGGSLVGSWMNDSGFWIFAKMSGLTEVEALKSWTPMLVVLGFVSFGVSLLMASLLPLV